jgi:hypothetical protein
MRLISDLAKMSAQNEEEERWTAVDQYALHQLDYAETPYCEALDHASELSVSEGLPDMAVSPLQGRFLKLQCMAINAKNVLELGTLGGYSTIWLASSSPETKVTTIEIDQKHKDVAEKAFQSAALSDRIELILGAGVDILPRIREDVEARRREQFDLVFVRLAFDRICVRIASTDSDIADRRGQAEQPQLSERGHPDVSPACADHHRQCRAQRQPRRCGAC